MIDEDFAKRLVSIPKASDVVRELFDAARKVSEQRLFVAIIDVQLITHMGKPTPVWLNLRHLVAQQFIEYFDKVNVPLDGLTDPSMANFFRRLQMLAYSQFWECRAIQRLLTQLMGITEGKLYDPHLLLGERAAGNVYESLVARARRSQLLISAYLAGTYSNQIRNAFMHSEFCVRGEYVDFFNFDARIGSAVPCLRLQTWDNLFAFTSEFIGAFFDARLACERELKDRAPYRIELDELICPFDLGKDKRGHWRLTAV